MKQHFINYLKNANIHIKIEDIDKNYYIKSVYSYFIDKKRITFEQKIALQNIKAK